MINEPTPRLQSLSSTRPSPNRIGCRLTDASGNAKPTHRMFYVNNVTPGNMDRLFDQVVKVCDQYTTIDDFLAWLLEADADYVGTAIESARKG